MSEDSATKTHFSEKNIEDFFSEILMKYVKLMLEKVLKFLRRYLALFLSYRDNPAGGGAESAPPPAGRGLIMCGRPTDRHNGPEPRLTLLKSVLPP